MQRLLATDPGRDVARALRAEPAVLGTRAASGVVEDVNVNGAAKPGLADLESRGKEGKESEVRANR